MFSTNYKRKSAIMLTAMMLVSFAAMAQPKAPSTMTNPLAQVLVLIMVLLALAIAIMGNVVNSAAALFRDKIRKEREAKKAGGQALIAVGLLIGGLATGLGALAQAANDAAAAAAPVVDDSINGLSPTTFYIMISVIAVEIIILIALIYQLKYLVGIETKKVFAVSAEEAAKPKEGWWWRISGAKAVAEEKDIDLSHDYDGISELDNKLPPWWIAAFAITILFSIVYMYRFHVSHSAPLMEEELEIAMKQAEVEKAAYLAKAGNAVDENTVKMLDDAAIAAGKATFVANCTPCHGAAGEGNTVGPNLTDEYWLHGGKINDVFKSIKYGWVEKGMRSWKDDFSPMQIAQLSSYIKSLKGSNPANAKAPQGDLFTEEGGTAAAGVTDSTAAAPKAN